jgi:peptidoglycan/xylan/chitin deacetylase (PgdA/CDA1 family)
LRYCHELYDHHTLDGIGRDLFLEELRKAQETLGENGAKCLRPPSGATDAYTRTYLDELGYKLVLWNIDTEDWRNPGADLIASRVPEQAQPGRIVLMHDSRKGDTEYLGGGDRTQTVEALEAVLKALSEQGYTFDVACQRP